MIMNHFIKLLICALFALIASLLLQLSNTGSIAGFDPLSFAIILVTCISSTLLGNTTSTTAKAVKKPAGNREQGKVKWFNVSKGYGFVTRESGEDIFVHFRSIRGEGRRSLREGQAVAFTVTDSDKGPQAEDVEALG